MQSLGGQRGLMLMLMLMRAPPSSSFYCRPIVPVPSPCALTVPLVLPLIGDGPGCDSRQVGPGRMRRLGPGQARQRVLLPPLPPPLRR